MALDPYSLCPCGSGKKLKFCCQAIAEEMERIGRLIEDNQLRAALKQLEALDKRQPNNEWITTTRALVLIESHEAMAARDVLRPWLAAHPESDFATVLYAMAELQAEGYDAAKKAVQRAYQKGAKKFPGLISGLAETVALVMLSRGQPMAARESLSLALRFASESERQNIFMRLLELDNEQDILYPLRSMHPLPAIEVPAEHDKDYKRAVKLALIGCWDMAADQYAVLAEKLPDVAALTQAAGLCRAWDGDGARAAQDLHRAAAKLADFPVAVECETIAQLFNLSESKETHAILAHDAEVASVSRLLSTLDEQDRLVRVPPPQERPQASLVPSALYQVLDRSKHAEQDAANLSLESVANVLAQVVIYDAQHDQPARLVISGMGGPSFDAALEQVKSLAGDQLVWSTEPPEAVNETPQELDLFHWQWSLPPKTPLGKRQSLEREQWRRVLTDRWPNQPQAALGGKSPRDAAGDPALRTQLTAAVYVLDAICARRRHALDVPAMLASLGLEPLPVLTLAPDVVPNSLSLMQLHRLTPSSLTDNQLSAVVNRAMLTHHDSFLEPVLKEAVKRPHCIPENELPRVYQTLADVSATQGHLDDALQWVDEARRNAAGHEASFTDLWQWDLRELMLRLTHPTVPPDPQLAALLNKFAVYYSPKLPQLRSYLEMILEEAGVESPWSSSGIITPDMAAAGAIGSGGVWTPEAETASAGGGKLWLPGQ